MATVVFADLVGGTGLFERLGDETAGRSVTQLAGATGVSMVATGKQRLLDEPEAESAPTVLFSVRA